LAFQSSQAVRNFAPLIAIDLRSFDIDSVPCHTATNIRSNQRGMNPSLRHKNGAYREFGTGMEVRLAAGVNYARECTGGGG
jgi:hypothetical protein